MKVLLLSLISIIMLIPSDLVGISALEHEPSPEWSNKSNTIAVTNMDSEEKEYYFSDLVETKSSERGLELEDLISTLAFEFPDHEQVLTNGDAHKLLYLKLIATQNTGKLSILIPLFDEEKEDYNEYIDFAIPQGSVNIDGSGNEFKFKFGKINSKPYIVLEINEPFLSETETVEGLEIPLSIRMKDGISRNNTTFKMKPIIVNNDWRDTDTLEVLKEGEDFEFSSTGNLSNFNVNYYNLQYINSNFDVPFVHGQVSYEDSRVEHLNLSFFIDSEYNKNSIYAEESDVIVKLKIDEDLVLDETLENFGAVLRNQSNIEENKIISSTYNNETHVLTLNLHLKNESKKNDVADLIYTKEFQNDIMITFEGVKHAIKDEQKQKLLFEVDIQGNVYTNDRDLNSSFTYTDTSSISISISRARLYGRVTLR